MNCKACQGPGGEEMRRWWGCDAPVEGEPLLAVQCWRCGGMDCECELCSGEGEVAVDRCPHAVVEQESYEICSFVNLLEVGVLPMSGGFLDQSASFVAAVTFAAGLKAKLEQDQYNVEGG